MIFHLIGKGYTIDVFISLYKHYPLKYVTNFLVRIKNWLKNSTLSAFCFEDLNACWIWIKITALVAFFRFSRESQGLLYLYQNHYTIVAFLIENFNACYIFCLKISTLAPSFWRSLHLFQKSQRFLRLSRVYLSCRYVDIIRCITTREIRRV